jgi:hypothetical protein
MIGRRTLIRIAALAGASPALAAPSAPPTTARTRSALSPFAGDPDATCVAFKIDGWEGRRDDVAGNRNVESPTEAWISINRSWRAAWR